MTFVMARVMCLNCATEMTKQGKDVYYCPTCCKFHRLKGMIPVTEQVTYEDAQVAMAEEVAESGLEELVG